MGHLLTGFSSSCSTVVSWERSLVNVMGVGEGIQAGILSVVLMKNFVTQTHPMVVTEEAFSENVLLSEK